MEIRSASVLIASRGRRAMLRETLRSLYALSAPFPVELVVVASGCPATAALLAQERPPEWVTYLPTLCDRPGKSLAVNRGLERCRADAVVFTDDDVLFQEGFFEALRDGFERLGCEALQGGVRVRLEGPRPAWWTDFCSALMADTTGYPPHPDELNGCNMAVRLATARAHAWPEDFGPGTRFPMAEDVIWSQRLAAGGARFALWEPMLVLHRLPAARLRRFPLLQRNWRNGRVQALLEGRRSLSVRALLGKLVHEFQPDMDGALRMARTLGYMGGAGGRK